MTVRRLVWEAQWFEAFRELALQDLGTARQIRQQVNALARDPEPSNSVRWGTSSFFRLRVGEWRVLYQVDEDTVRIWSLGRSPGSIRS